MLFLDGCLFINAVFIIAHPYAYYCSLAQSPLSDYETMFARLVETGSPKTIDYIKLHFLSVVALAQGFQLEKLFTSFNIEALHGHVTREHFLKYSIF